MLLGACVPGAIGREIVLPAGLPHRLSPDAVEAIVLEEDDHARAILGSEIRPFRVTRIVLVPANTPFEVTTVDGSPGRRLSRPFTIWAVEAEGTFLECGSTCTA